MSWFITPPRPGAVERGSRQEEIELSVAEYGVGRSQSGSGVTLQDPLSGVS